MDRTWQRNSWDAGKDEVTLILDPTPLTRAEAFEPAPWARTLPPEPPPAHEDAAPSSGRITLPPLLTTRNRLTEARRVAIGVAAAALFLVSLAAGMVLGPKHGTLRVVLVDERGELVERAEIYVDGVKHCDVSPCVAKELFPGNKTVQVLARGAAPVTLSGVVAAAEERTAIVPLQFVPRVVDERSGAESPLRERCAAGAEPVAVVLDTAAPPAPEPVPGAIVAFDALPSVDVAAALPPAHTPNAATSPRPEPPRAAPSPPEPQARAADKPRGSPRALLQLNSIPVSKVLLDGSPLGTTPKVDVAVSPGTHTVTFVHPDHGRRSVTVNVGAGETKTAAVRFARGR